MTETRMEGLAHSRAFVLRLAIAIALVVAGLQLAVTAVSADDPAPNPGVANQEVKYMTDMIDHHMMAVHMAEMCQEMGVRPELEAMCEEIVSTQMAEIMMLQGWLLDWYGIDYDPMTEGHMKPKDMRMMDMMEGMSTADFEVAFMEHMIEHHMGAIKASEKLMKHAYHQDLLDMAEDIIEAQSDEIEMMQMWLEDWHGVSAKKSGGPGGHM
jgi:uncharacterized protein (DUF305 family)